MRYQPITMFDFGGLNEDENPSSLAQNDLVLALNTWRRGRSTGTRPGTVRDPDVYTADITGTPQIMGIADYRYNRDSERELIVVTNGKVWSDATTEVDLATNSVNVTTANGEPWSFAVHKDKLYAAGGTVGTSTPWVLDRNLAATADNEATPLVINNIAASLTGSPRFIHSFSNRLFAGGFPDNANNDGSLNEEIVRYSALNDFETWPTRNTIGGFSSVGGFSGRGDEYITGLNNYQDNRGRWLLTLTNRKLYSFRETPSSLAPFQNDDSVSNGCVSHAAYVNLGIDASDGVYMSEHGIHSLRQSQERGPAEDAFLSFKIRKTFETINMSRREQIVGAYWRTRGLVLFAVPTGSSTVNDTILALDVRDISSGSPLNPQTNLTADNARWYIWKLSGHNAAYLQEVQLAGSDDGKWRIFGGNYAGGIFHFTESAYTDLGSGYGTAFQTKHLAPTSIGKFRVGHVLSDLQPGGSYMPSLTLYFDYGARSTRPKRLHMPGETTLWGPTGGMVWGVSKWDSGEATRNTKSYVVGSGESVSYRYSHDGVNEPFYISRMTATLAESGAADADGA